MDTSDRQVPDNTKKDPIITSILENMALPCEEYIKYRDTQKSNLKTCIYVLIHNPKRKNLKLYFKDINNKDRKQNKLILDDNIKYSNIPKIIEPITRCVNSIIVYRSATGVITEIAAKDFHGKILEKYNEVMTLDLQPAQSGGKTLKAKKLSSKRNTLKSNAKASHRKI